MQKILQKIINDTAALLHVDEYEVMATVFCPNCRNDSLNTKAAIRRAQKDDDKPWSPVHDPPRGLEVSATHSMDRPVRSTRKTKAKISAVDLTADDD